MKKVLILADSTLDLKLILKDLLKYFLKEISFDQIVYFQANSKIGINGLKRRLNKLRIIMQNQKILNNLLLDNFTIDKFSLELTSKPENIKHIVKGLNKFLNEEELFIPRKIHEYALIHDTHNNKLEKIHKKNKYILYKSNGEIKILDLLNGSKEEFIGRNVVIVENQFIFDLSIKESIEYFKNFESYPNIRESIIIYGAGNFIASERKELKDIFNSCKEIFYFGDLDDAGYQIFLSFKKNLNVKTNFILPKKNIYLQVQLMMKQDKYIKAREKIIEKSKKNDKTFQIFIEKGGDLDLFLSEFYKIDFNLMVVNQEIFLTK